MINAGCPGPEFASCVRVWVSQGVSKFRHQQIFLSFMVLYDWPRDRAYVYQIFLIVSIWCWWDFIIFSPISFPLELWFRSFYQVIFMYDFWWYCVCLFRVFIILQDLMWLLFRNCELSGSGFHVNLLLCDGKRFIKIIRVLTFASIPSGSTDHRSIWAQAQPLPRSSGCTCLLSFVSPSITLILSLDLRLILSASISIIPVRPSWARSKSSYRHWACFQMFIPADMINFFIFHSSKSGSVLEMQLSWSRPFKFSFMYTTWEKAWVLTSDGPFLELMWS